jgi:hypothetical protein
VTWAPEAPWKRRSGKLQAKHVSQGWIARSRHLDNALILAPMGRPPARPFGDVLVYSGCFVCAGAVSGFSRAAISRLRAATAGSSVSPRTQPCAVCDPVRDHHRGGAFQIDDDKGRLPGGAFDLVDDGFFRDVGDDREVLGAPFPSSPIRRRACWDRRRWTSAFITRRQSPSPPARFRAYNSLRPHCFHRNNLGLPMFCKEIVERLGEQILNGGVAVSSEDTQLLLHRRRKITRDIALPFSARPEVQTLGCGRRRVVLLGGGLWCRHLVTRLKRLP